MIWKKEYHRLLAALLIFLALAACSRQAAPTATLMPVATGTALPAATAIAPPTDTPTSTPEPLIPFVSASDQVLTENGRLTVDLVVAAEAGWLALHADQNGAPGEILGFAPVGRGEHENVAIIIDPYEATPIFHAVLHLDAGEMGTFEFPGPDAAVRVGSSLVGATFEAELQVLMPSINVTDQDIGEDGQVIVNQVEAAGRGWIALHIDEAGRPGKMLAYMPVGEGNNLDIPLFVNRWEATPTMHALLYSDDGKLGDFEYPDGDPPVIINEQQVLTTFRLGLPPDVFVLDQPVVDEMIVIERAISDGPGWVVVYLDEEGQPGNIIGWAHLDDGVNEQFDVPLALTTVTPQLYVVIHEDLEEIDEFGFPRTDPPRKYQERLPNPIAFRTDSGNYMITRDQLLSEGNEIAVPLVVVGVDAWVVVRNEVRGEPGEISGKTWIPAGVNHEVKVTLDPALTGDTMVVILHIDAGEPGVFDYPDGLDIPFQRNRSEIQTPFNLLEESDG